MVKHQHVIDCFATGKHPKQLEICENAKQLWIDSKECLRSLLLLLMTMMLTIFIVDLFYYLITQTNCYFCKMRTETEIENTRY